MKHIMIDLETMGQAPDGVIISIGAVKFDLNLDASTPIYDEFHVGIHPHVQTTFKRTFDADTVLWWLNPDRAEAFAKWTALEKVDLVSALDGFCQLVGSEPHCVWGNGVSFDNVILGSALKAVGLEQPWHWGSDRDFRTLKSLAPRNLEPKRAGVVHDALDDARHQTLWLLEIAAHLNVAL